MKIKFGYKYRGRGHQVKSLRSHAHLHTPGKYPNNDKEFKISNKEIIQVIVDATCLSQIYLYKMYINCPRRNSCKLY